MDHCVCAGDDDGGGDALGTLNDVILFVAKQQNDYGIQILLTFNENIEIIIYWYICYSKMYSLL